MESARRRRPDHKLGTEAHLSRAGTWVAEYVEQQLDRGRADLARRLPDGRQGDDRGLGEVDVVVADDREFLRHTRTAQNRGTLQHPDREQVVRVAARSSAPRDINDGAQCSDASAAVRTHSRNTTSSPARVGAQTNGPAEARASAGNGATRTRRSASPSMPARTTSASRSRLTRTRSWRPDHSGTAPTDQSDSPSVTTAPTPSTPSAHSTPALIHRSALSRTKMPAPVEL